MNKASTKGVPVMATGFDVPVSISHGAKGQNCIALSADRDRIIITIFKGGKGFSAWIGGDQIDAVAGAFADMVLEVNQREAPSTRVVQ